MSQVSPCGDPRLRAKLCGGSFKALVITSLGSIRRYGLERLKVGPVDALVFPASEDRSARLRSDFIALLAAVCQLSIRDRNIFLVNVGGKPGAPVASLCLQNI